MIHRSGASRFRSIRRLTILVGLILGLGACGLFLDADQRVSRADAKIAAHEFRAAVIELKKALQEEPTHVHARELLAAVELQLGDVASADKDLRRALELGADPRANAELMARIKLAMGEAGDLLVLIQSGEVALEGSAKAVYRGQALLALQDFEAAQTEFQLVKSGDARYDIARVGFADALAGQGKAAQAIAVLDAVIAHNPASFEAWLARGATHAKRGEFAAAATDLQRARTLAGADLPATPHIKLLSGLCEVQLGNGDLAGATSTQQELAQQAPNALVTQVLAARIAMLKQDYSAATASLQRSLAMAPDLVPVRFLLAASLLAQNNLGQAERHLTQVVQAAPENIEARKLMAQVQLRLGRPDSAMQVLSVAQTTDDPQLDLLRGLAHLQQGEESAGSELLERAARANPEDSKLRTDLAAAYLRTQRADKAVALLSAVPRSAATVRDVALLVSAYETIAQPREAQAEIEQLIVARPADAEALELAANFFVYRRDFGRARALSQRAIEVAAKDVGPLLARGRIEAQAGDLEAAGQWIAKALILDPASGPAHLTQAELFRRRGDVAGAVRTLEDLRKRDATAVEPRLRLVAIYLQQRNSKAAQPVIAEVAELGKNRPEVLNALGQLYLDSGRYDEALLRFQSATLQDATNPLYWLNTARAQITLGNSSVAREALEKAVAAQPGWIPAVGTLAMLDVKEGHGGAALARVKALATARPRDVAALTLQGDVHMVVREYADAAAAFDAALAVKPAASLALKSYRARQLAKLPNPARPLQSWLSAHPNDDLVRMALAESLQMSGDRAAAVEEYQAIERRGQAPPVMLNNLAWLYYQLGDGRAEKTAQQAFERAPESAPIADTYGWILVEGDKAAQALPILKAAVSKTDDPATEYHYAVALLRTGAKDEGRRRLTSVLARDARFEGAAQARELLNSTGAP